MNTAIIDALNEMILFLFNSRIKQDKVDNLKIIK